MNRKSRSLILLTLTAIIWGFAFVAQRVGGNSTGSLTYNAIRFALGSFSLIPVMLIFEKKLRTDKKYIIPVMPVCFVVFFYLPPVPSSNTVSC